MRKVVLILVVTCSLTDLVAAQTSTLHSIIKESVVSYIKYRDSIDDEVFKHAGIQHVDRTMWKRYVLPELIGADNIIFPSSSKCDEVALLWVTKKKDVKRLLNKKRAEDYPWYYWVSLNIEDGEFAVYVMTGLKRKFGETLQGRYSYGLKDGVLSLHTIDYKWTDVKQTYNNPAVGKAIASHTLEDMLFIWKEDSITQKFFFDTIDVLQSITIWRDSYLSEKLGIHYSYLTSLRTGMLSARTKPLLSIDYSLNQQGSILVYLRTIFWQNQKGENKHLQQHCSSALVFTLSPDVNGEYRMVSYKRVNGI